MIALGIMAIWRPLGCALAEGQSVWETVLAEHGLQRVVWPGARDRIQLLHACQLVCGRRDAGGDPAHCLAGLGLGSSPQAATLEGLDAIGKPWAAAAGAQIGGDCSLLWLIVLHRARALLLLICKVALLELMCVLLLLQEAAHLLPSMDAWRCRGLRHGCAGCRRCGVAIDLPAGHYCVLWVP